MSAEFGSDEAILSVARAKGVFTVSAKERSAILERCRRLKRAGRLIGGKPRGGCIVYFPAPGS